MKKILICKQMSQAAHQKLLDGIACVNTPVYKNATTDNLLSNLNIELWK